MEFADTDEQALLRDSVRRFAAQRHPFQGSGKATARKGCWTEVAANGWTAVGLAEEAAGQSCCRLSLRSSRKSSAEGW